MKSIVYGCFVLLLLTGCRSSDWPSAKVVAEPLQPSSQQEMLLLRLEQVLVTAPLNDDDRIALLYERGRIYDKLGLYVLARNDFTQALLLKPNTAVLFGYLGKYAMQEQKFSAAYEAFDAILDLEPDNRSVYKDRGIALYYGDRHNLAYADLLDYYRANPDDPLAVLWLYFIELEHSAVSANQHLSQRYQSANKHDLKWQLVAFFLGKINEESVLTTLEKELTDNTLHASYLCEINFYLGKYYLSRGDSSRAYTLFKLAIASNAYAEDAHRYALLELAQLADKRSSITSKFNNKLVT